MEQHPVPQNVTTFQFRLIGDMTIKQFGYLAGGFILAYICYKLPLPFFFTWPLAGIFGLGGLGFAFVPIEERPMDVWVLSFLKNVYSPTQFLWHKQKKEEVTAQASTNPLDLLGVLSKKKPSSIPKPSAPHTHETPAPAVVSALPSQTRVISSSSQKHGMFFDIGQLFLHKTHPGANHPQPSLHPALKHPPQPPLPQHAAPRTVPHGRTIILSEWFMEPSQWFSSLFKMLSIKKIKPVPPSPPGMFGPAQPASITGSRLDLTPQAPVVQQVAAATPLEVEQKTALEHRLASLQQELASKTATDTRMKQLQEQITQALSDRSKMEQEIVTLRQKLSTQTAQQSALRPATVAQPTTPSPTVRIVTADMAQKAGLPRLTTFPNVITGILKDNTGNLLPGVLVTVRDKDDVPVRALKSNKLGQFAASTPLPNGTFTIDIEDPRSQYIFDRIALTLIGDVMPAVEVTAKNQKQVARDKLAAEIFGKQSL